MIHQHSDGRIEFAFFRPGATRVDLIGEFGPQSAPHLMQRDEQGWWRLHLTLPAGEYRFRYQVDETMWEADFAAYGVEHDRDGGWSSILWVKPADASAKAAA